MKVSTRTVATLCVVAGLLYVVFLGAASNYPEEMGNIDVSSAQRERESTPEDVFVLEYDADSAAECDAGDTFNKAEKVCEYECVDEAECTQLANEAEAELAQWGDQYEEATDKVSEKPTGENALAAVYRVGAHEAITLAQGAEKPVYREIWAQIAALSPDAFSDAYIERFGVYNDKASDTLAYVVDEDGNGKWDIVVNAGWYPTATSRERATTLIHELGHIVTLNKAQVNTDIEEASCAAPAFFTGEGCAARGSYIAKFFASFWSAADLAKVGGPLGEGGEGSAALYAKKESSFVTEYAATNPGEDIAESFALFILDKKNDAPKTIAEKKVASLYMQPSLVSFRTEMRSALVTGIVRARRAAR